VTPVSLEVVGDASRASSPPAQQVSASVYTLQVAAFSDREKARIVSEKMEKELAYATVRRVDTDTAVSIGSTREDSVRAPMPKRHDPPWPGTGTRHLHRGGVICSLPGQPSFHAK
jgi:hypothetical protein